MIKESTEDYMETMSIASFFLLWDRSEETDLTVIDTAFKAEEYEAWPIAMDLYLTFWLWVKNVPKKYRKYTVALLMEDYL